MFIRAEDGKTILADRRHAHTNVNDGEHTLAPMSYGDNVGKEIGDVG